MSQMVQKMTETVTVSGKGADKNQAFAAALNKIHSQILKETKEVVLRIEPLDIKVITAKEETYKEHFLFFFLPRVRTNYEVLLDVEIEVSLIEVEKIPFTQTAVKDPQAIPLPHWKKKKVKGEI